MYIFIENNNTKTGKKTKEGRKEWSRTRTQQLRLDANTPNHCTTEADYVTLGKSLFHRVKRPPARWSCCINPAIFTVKINNVNAYSMAMNEWKNVIKLYKTPIHVLVCKVGRKTHVLDFHCYFEANGQNHIHFRLIQVLKNSMAWHFLTFTSPSSKLEFVYPPCCGVEKQMLTFLLNLTPERVKGSWIEIQSPS